MMKMAKRRRNVIITGVVVVIVYMASYVACRSRNELIHRKTWAHGWNRHWIELGHPEPPIMPHPFAPMHIPGDDEYNAAIDRFKKEFKTIASRRKVFGVIFFPLRCCESLLWWMVDARDN